MCVESFHNNNLIISIYVLLKANDEKADNDDDDDDDEQFREKRSADGTERFSYALYFIFKLHKLKFITFVLLNTVKILICSM